MPESVAPSGKKRHGCLTTYLAFLILANALTALLYLLGGDAMRQRLPNIPNWAFPVLGVTGIINIVCAFGLFTWKRWGFWGFVASTALVFVINLSIGLSVVSAAVGLIGVAILFGVLQIGKENKGWPQLD